MKGQASSVAVCAAAVAAMVMLLAYPEMAGAQTEVAPQESVGEPLSTASPAEADASKLECPRHYEAAQILRREGRLLAGRAELLLCSLASCPGAIRADCVDWIEQVSRSLPSVVVTAHAQGHDVANVKVFVDDELVAERLSGAAIDLDPGEHRIRFESPPWPNVDRTILVSEGVKGRALDIEFAPPSEAVRPSPIPSSPPPISSPSGRRVRAVDYALGGLALAGLGTFAVAGSWALYQRHDLEQRCAPFCADDQVKSVQTKLLVADVALGTAVVSLAVLYFHLSRAPVDGAVSAARTSSVSAVAQVTHQSAAFGVGGTF